jgi:hypothetical protein
MKGGAKTSDTLSGLLRQIRGKLYQTYLQTIALGLSLRCLQFHCFRGVCSSQLLTGRRQVRCTILLTTECGEVTETEKYSVLLCVLGGLCGELWQSPVSARLNDVPFGPPARLLAHGRVRAGQAFPRGIARLAPQEGHFERLQRNLCWISLYIRGLSASGSKSLSQSLQSFYTTLTWT